MAGCSCSLPQGNWRSLVLYRATLFIIVFLAVSAFAVEPLKTVQSPKTVLELNGFGELHDDVYSGDIGASVEYAPCNCLSLYADVAYRFFSYEWNTMLHDQIHEAVNLQTNGFNESYLGMKFFPLDYFGIDLNWRSKPGEGSQRDRFMRFGVEPMGLYKFSRNLLLGLSAQYYTFIEDDNYQPGDEVGVKGSFVWNFLWNHENKTGWEISYAYLFRWRIQESENLNLDKPYQKMDDEYRGFRMRGAVARYLGWLQFPVGVGMAYEMNRGTLFGFETGHRVEFFLKADL